MKIIREPYRKSMPQGGYLLLYDCDDGKTYTIKELAEICSMKEHRSLHNRIYKYGWDSEWILHRGPIPKSVGNGTDEWKMLGD